MKIKTALIALFACSMQAIGQTHLPDMAFDREFTAQVKSIDEFMARFNGDEIKTGVMSDSLRRDNILSLFDFKMSHEGLNDDDFKQQLIDFTNTAINWEKRLLLSSKGVIAEAKCIVHYAGKQHVVTLLMKRDSTAKGNNKWGIEGVCGLEKLKLYDDKRVTISPVDHETHFISLQDFFQSNWTLVPSLRANDKEIDQMSFFFGLCVAKAIDFVRVDELKFHFMDMPSYIFVVEEIGRKGTNSGWLITKIKKTLNSSEKKQYYNNLLNIKE